MRYVSYTLVPLALLLAMTPSASAAIYHPMCRYMVGHVYHSRLCPPGYRRGQIIYDHHGPGYRPGGPGHRPPVPVRPL